LVGSQSIVSPSEALAKEGHSVALPSEALAEEGRSIVIFSKEMFANCLLPTADF